MPQGRLVLVDARNLYRVAPVAEQKETSAAPDCEKEAPQAKGKTSSESKVMPRANPNSNARRPAGVSRRPDPTGRVDLLAIGLLERAITLYGDLPLRGIYGTLKPEIDRSIRRHLGKIKIYVPPQIQAPAAKPTVKPKPADPKAMTLRQGADGVYEVCDAR